MQEDEEIPLKSIEKVSERIRILRFAEDLISKFDKLVLSKGASLMLVLPPFNNSKCLLQFILSLSNFIIV